MTPKMETIRFRTVSLLQLGVLVDVLWSLTASFETFNPSKCMELFGDHTVFGKSYLDCVDSCKTMIDCTGVSYQRRQLRCRNHYIVSDATLKECQSYVLSMKSEWRLQDGECMCPARKSCNQSGDCLFSGCPTLQGPTHGQVYGNMLGIGVNVMIKCSPGYMYVLNQTGALVCKDDGQWSGEIPSCIEDPECTRSLVGMVGDDQLSQSSFWCETSKYFYCMTAKYARLNCTGSHTGAWAADGNGTDEYIQVDFLKRSVVSGIALKGRHYVPYHQQQYVTKFRLLTSTDCATFEAIKEDSGEDKIFDGNTRPETPQYSETVKRSLAERVIARCVRINPTEYVLHIALRFDVLGC